MRGGQRKQAHRPKKQLKGWIETSSPVLPCVRVSVCPSDHLLELVVVGPLVFLLAPSNDFFLAEPLPFFICFFSDLSEISM